MFTKEVDSILEIEVNGMSITDRLGVLRRQNAFRCNNYNYQSLGHYLITGYNYLNVF